MQNGVDTLIGNGGVTDGSVFRQIESIASEMLSPIRLQMTTFQEFIR